MAFQEWLPLTTTDPTNPVINQDNNTIHEVTISPKMEQSPSTNTQVSPILQKLTPPPLHEAIITGGVYIRIERALDVIRLLFSIVALLYFGMRMMVLSGMISQEWAKYSLYLEPGLFLLVCLYLGQWIAKFAVSASIRFASIRFVTMGISAILTILYTLYWGHVLQF